MENSTSRNTRGFFCWFVSHPLSLPSTFSLLASRRKEGPKNGYKMMVYFKFKHHQPRAPLRVVFASAAACSATNAAVLVIWTAVRQCRLGWPARSTGEDRRQLNTDMINRGEGERTNERPAKCYITFLLSEKMTNFNTLLVARRRASAHLLHVTMSRKLYPSTNRMLCAS